MRRIARPAAALLALLLPAGAWAQNGPQIHPPEPLGQFVFDQTGTLVPVAPGEMIHSVPTVVFRMPYPPPGGDGGQFHVVVFEIEVVPAGTPFTGVASQTQMFIGVPVTWDCALFFPNGDYEWRARVIGATPYGQTSTSAWADFGLSGADFSVNVVPGNTVPHPPSLGPSAPDEGQFDGDAATPVPLGGMLSHSSVVLRARLGDPEGNDCLVEVEVKRADRPFDGSGTLKSPLVPPGSPADVTVFGLDPDQGYHWRARSHDVHGYRSAWVSFGGNAETEADFRTGSRGSSGGTGGGPSCGGSTAGAAGFLPFGWAALLLSRRGAP